MRFKASRAKSKAGGFLSWSKQVVGVGVTLSLSHHGSCFQESPSDLWRKLVTGKELWHCEPTISRYCQCLGLPFENQWYPESNEDGKWRQLVGRDCGYHLVPQKPNNTTAQQPSKTHAPQKPNNTTTQQQSTSRNKPPIPQNYLTTHQLKKEKLNKKQNRNNSTLNRRI